MADFDAAGTDESQMFGPELGADLVHEACHLIEALGFDRGRRREAEADAVENDGNLSREHLKSADLAARREKKIVGDDFEKIDRVEMLENPGS
jgi:hypothetical protein